MRPPRLHLTAALLCLAAASAGLTGCGAGASADQNGKASGPPVVVATTGMIADLAVHVGGDAVEVVTLLGPGVDPHLYSPTIDDVRTLRDADLVLYSGLKLEEGLARQFEAREKSGAAVAAVTADLPADRLLSPPDFDGHPDPHVWNDVALWADCLDRVAAELSAVLPEKKKAFEANAAAYKQELLALDERVRAAVATVPEGRRTLVTAHDAFGYFSRAYDIPVRSVQGVSTESEAGVADVNALAKFLADSGVNAIFAETSVSDRAMKAVIEGANQRGGTVRISDTPLYADAVGPAGSGADDYRGMIASNVTAIVTELGGELPANGLLPAE